MSDELKKDKEDVKPVLLDKKQLQVQLKATIRKIQTRRREIYKMQGSRDTQPYTPKTSGHFKMNENDSNVININTSQDIVYLLKALSLINRIEREYEMQADLLNLQTYPKCTWLTIPMDSWRQDLTNRITQVAYADELRALTDSEAQLKSFLTEEDRLSATLKHIGNLFKVGKIKESKMEFEEEGQEG